MSMLTDRSPYSFVADPSVPSFDPPDHFTVMDAHCGLCAKTARWIVRNDTQGRFGIVPMQSALGTALLHHYGMDPEDPRSWLYVRMGVAYTSLDAVIRIGSELGGIWRTLRAFRVLPRSLQDALYNLVARNRYRFIGRVDWCSMPDPEIRDRLIQ